MANGQNADLSVGMDQILQLSEITANMLYNLMESQKAKMKNLVPGVSQVGEKAGNTEKTENISTEKTENQAVIENTDNSFDADLLNKLDKAFKEFLLISREALSQTQVIDLKNVEQLIDSKPITQEEKILAKEINGLDQAVNRANKSLNQFSEAAQNNRIGRRTVIRSLGEKMIQIDDKRIEVVKNIENYFSNMTNRARIGFATWMVNQFDGINNRFEQIKHVANQQIEEINRLDKNNPNVKTVAVLKENSLSNEQIRDSKSPDIDKIRALLLTMENNMSDLTRAIHAVNQTPTETRTITNQANPLKSINEEKVQTQEGDAVMKDQTMINASATDRIIHADEYGVMLLDLHDGFDHDPTKLADFIQFSTRFQKYTTRNQQLIFSQNRNALQVNNRNDFLKDGLHVKKGEKAMKVFVPNTSNVGPKFKMGLVYDINQTDCPERISRVSDENTLLTNDIQAYCDNEIKPKNNALKSQLEAQGIAMMLMAHNNVAATPEMKKQFSQTYQAYRQGFKGTKLDRQRNLDATFKSMNKNYQEHVEELDQYLNYTPVNQSEENYQDEAWEPEM